MDYILKSLNKQEKQLDELKAMLLGQKTVLSFDEAAIYTGFSKSHLYKLTSLGDIPHSKPKGKMIFFHREELDQWLLQNPIKITEVIQSEASNYVTLKGKGGSK